MPPAVANEPVTVSFTIRQPSGEPLTTYKHGPGPHTGVHLIVVRRDLSVLIHRHPPIGAGGRIEETIRFPSPGPYRVLVDAYPAKTRNFQLHREIRVAGAYRPQPLPPFNPVVALNGYRISLAGPKVLHAIEPAFFTATVTDPQGRPARFTPWFGALAHAIFFRSGSLDYFHTHVCSAGMTGCTSILGSTRITGRATKPGQLRVGVLVPVPGTWRLFLQCKVDGRVLTAPFTLVVG